MILLLVQATWCFSFTPPRQLRYPLLPDTPWVIPNQFDLCSPLLLSGFTRSFPQIYLVSVNALPCRIPQKYSLLNKTVNQVSLKKKAFEKKQRNHFLFACPYLQGK